MDRVKQPDGGGDAPRPSQNTEAAPGSSPEAPASDPRAAALALWEEGDLTGALEGLTTLLQGLQNGKAPKRTIRSVYKSTLHLLCDMKRWPEVRDLSLAAIDRFPDKAFGHRFLGEARFRLGDMEAAEAAFQAALDRDPLEGASRMALALLKRGPGPSAPRKSPRLWPADQSLFEHPRRVLERYLFRDYPDQPLVQPDTVFATLGSCFADNLARRLGEAGFRVNSQPIGENVNSTYANASLLKWIENGPSDGPTSIMQEVYGSEMRGQFKHAFQSADVFVFTLGVAPCFFDRETGEFAFSTTESIFGREYLNQHCVMRTTTVAENISNIKAILDGLERLAGRRQKIVMTISPVALQATTEFYSAITADCLSKSTLRLACHEICEQRPDIVYWPSFEIVRWLGVHYNRPDRPVFAQEDGNTRHVSNWVVDLIIDLFIQHHSAAGVDSKAAEGAFPSES